MMKIYIIIFAIIPFSLRSQSKYDNNWVIGYDTSLLDNTGNAIQIDFNQNPAAVREVNSISGFFGTGALTAMSDSNGQLLFYTSGCYVVNAQGGIMENGDSINPGYIQHYYCPQGYSPILDGAIAIPWPDSPGLYILFVKDYEDVMFPDDPFETNGGSLHLYYDVIDMRKAGGMGAVTLKNEIAISDTLCPNSIEACRHANGRDWWILVGESHKNCFYSLLVTPDGVQMPQKTCEGVPWLHNDQVGQSCFSPDGSKFIRFSDENGLHIFDFDNETGALSNQRVITFDNYHSYYTGVAVSPNSRFLYACMGGYLFQFDMAATDIAASRQLIAVRDAVPDPFVYSGFYLAALGADNKIYISAGGSHLGLHIIHRPDCPGQYSMVQQRGLRLPSFNYFAVPNLPAYGHPPSNSPCDSISSVLYEPVPDKGTIVLFPNPAQEFVNIFYNQKISATATFNLYDALGRLAKTALLDPGSSLHTISLEGLAPGVYFYSIQTEGRVWKQGRLFKS